MSSSVAADVITQILNMRNSGRLTGPHTHSAANGGLIVTDGPITQTNPLTPAIITASQILNQNFNADLWRGHRFSTASTAPLNPNQGDLWLNTTTYNQFLLEFWDGHQWVTIGALRFDANGVLVGTRPELNLIAGSNITITGTDNAAQNRVDVTIASTSASTPHPLLDGVQNNDTDASTPALGSLIHGNSDTPSTWDAFTIGTAGQYLRVSVGDVGWSSQLDTESGNALPGAGTTGRLFQRTSDNTLWFDTGVIWVQA